jgi:hypothetical protein
MYKLEFIIILLHCALRLRARVFKCCDVSKLEKAKKIKNQNIKSETGNQKTQHAFMTPLLYHTTPSILPVSG